MADNNLSNSLFALAESTCWTTWFIAIGPDLTRPVYYADPLFTETHRLMTVGGTSQHSCLSCKAFNPSSALFVVTGWSTLFLMKHFHNVCTLTTLTHYIGPYIKTYSVCIFGNTPQILKICLVAISCYFSQIMSSCFFVFHICATVKNTHECSAIFLKSQLQQRKEAGGKEQRMQRFQNTKLIF